MLRPRSYRHDTLFPYTTLFRARGNARGRWLQNFQKFRPAISERADAGTFTRKREGNEELAGLRLRNAVAEMAECGDGHVDFGYRSEEHTSELQSLMRT